MSAENGNVTPDPAQIERFVNSMFANATEGGVISLRAFYGDDLAKARDEPPFRIRSIRLNGEGLAPVVRQAVRMAEEAVGSSRPVVVAPPIATFVNGKAKASTLLEGLTLSIELDERPAQSLAILLATIGSPTLVVASGGLWLDGETGELHDKLHIHYLLAEPTQTPEEHARLKRARSLACDLVGADATSKSIVHPMRWAGTVHRKNPAAPRLARIIEQNETEIVLEDVLGELEGLEILRGEAPEPESTLDPAWDPTGDAELLMACAERIANADLTWAEWNRLGMAFWRASEGSEAGFAAFAALSCKSTKYDPDATRARWNHYPTSPPNQLSVRTLVFEARKNDPNFRRRKVKQPTGIGQLASIAILGAAELDTSDDGLALGMGEKWTDARHVALFGRWLFFNGQRWEQDECLIHLTRTREFLRDKGDELVRWAQQQNNEKLVETCEAIAKQLRAATKVAAVSGLARSNPAQVATVGEWDADPWLLGTPAGTVDLRTGLMRPARLADCITKVTSIAPAAAGFGAPIWQAFLQRIFRHDLELVPYMQRVAGYALTGLTTEHALVFCWGEGGNGKGVFFNTLAYVLADYAKVAAPDLLLETQSDRHPTDMAMLMGARLVIASEVPRGRAWNEPKLKSLTGGDPITARYMRQDFFTFMPAFTLLAAGNHKPSFRSIDEAIRRRVQLVPFLQNIPKEERDPDLGEKLKIEAPAILRWAIDGCLEWQRQGLNPPKGVREASESYLEGEDVLGQWIAERCIIAGTELTAFDTLFADWKSWCEANGGPGWGGKTFSKALDERGLRRDRDGQTRGFRGIQIRKKTPEENIKDAGRGKWETRF